MTAATSLSIQVGRNRRAAALASTEHRRLRRHRDYLQIQRGYHGRSPHRPRRAQVLRSQFRHIGSSASAQASHPWPRSRSRRVMCFSMPASQVLCKPASGTLRKRHWRKSDCFALLRICLVRCFSCASHASGDIYMSPKCEAQSSLIQEPVEDRVTPYPRRSSGPIATNTVHQLDFCTARQPMPRCRPTSRSICQAVSASWRPGSWCRLPPPHHLDGGPRTNSPDRQRASSASRSLAAWPTVKAGRCSSCPWRLSCRPGVTCARSPPDQPEGFPK